MNMKKLTTISLFIFGIIVTAILVAGLVFYQSKKNNQILNSKTGNSIPSTTVKPITTPSTTGKPITIPSARNITLNMTEIAKHNKSSDCWMLISGKVYNITSYFGSHPGGGNTMTPSCGKDATAAYMTKDPYASTSSSRSAHSSNALSLLNDYYIGNLNQTISK